MAEANNMSSYVRGLDEYSSDAELNSEDLFKSYPENLICAAVGCLIMFMIIGIPGNLITILALANYRKVNNATAKFIINLSCSDLLNCCFHLPVTIRILYTQHWFGGKLMCMMYPVINYGLTGCSVFNIVAITINRYVMVAHPNIYPTMYSKRNLFMMIVAIWIGAFTMLTPVLTNAWGRISLDTTVGFCTVVPDEDGNTPKMLYIIMGFIFPCTVIIVCYSRIMWIVRKSTKKMTNKPATQTDSSAPINNPEISEKETSSSAEVSSPNDNNNWALRRFRYTFKTTIKKPTRPTRRDRKLQMMIVAIIITFFVSHLPVMVAKLATSNFSGNPYGNIMGYIMLYMTTCSNPVIYVVLSHEYREAYKHLLKKVFRINR